MKFFLVVFAVFILSTARAYEGTLDVQKYANTLVNDAKANFTRGPRYPGSVYIVFEGSSASYVNVSDGILENQDDYVSLESASYLLDSHGKALSVILNFNILPHKVQFNYTSGSGTGNDRLETGTAVVSVGGYMISAISTFIGGDIPVDVYFFTYSEPIVTVTGDTEDHTVQLHWQDAGSGELQKQYEILIQSAIFYYDINEYFSKE